jgi:hypothetical protein
MKFWNYSPDGHKCSLWWKNDCGRATLEYPSCSHRWLTADWRSYGEGRETESASLVLFQHNREMLSDVPWFDAFPQFVYVDVLYIHLGV